MKKLNIYAALAVALGFGLSPVQSDAQISGNLSVPAEIPPASYTGKQYVDSRGCVYVRAGIDGNVTWVPRVARSRKVVCGMQPSSGGTRQAAAPRAAAPAPRPEVIEITPEASAPAVVAARPAAQPAPRVVRQQPVRRQAARAPVPTVAATPAPRRVQPKTVRRVVRAPATPTYKPVDEMGREGRVKTYAHSGQPACQGASPVSQRYINNGKGLPVRCGPQTEPIVTIKKHHKKVRTADGYQRVRVPGVKVYRGQSGATHVTGKTVIAPKAAYARGASEPVALPEGYEPAFKDGRLSTTRAHQTLDGRRKMLLTWTSHLPRRLIDRYTGEDVTHKFPYLRYPYTSMKQQQASAFVSSKGKAPVSTRKAMKQAKAAPVQAASHRYIQVGSFSSHAKAQGAIQRLQAAGLPVRVNEFTQRGKSYRMVLVGPFQRQDQLKSALHTVKNRIGYRSASLRK